MTERRHEQGHVPGSILGSMRRPIIHFQNRLLDGIVMTLIFIMLLTMLAALGGLVFDYIVATRLVINALESVGTMASHGFIKGILQHLVSDVLSVFILIELFRSFSDYLEFHRIRLQVLAEVGFVFVLREIFVGLYAQKLNWPDMLALGALLAVLAGTRAAATYFPPRPPGDGSR